MKVLVTGGAGFIGTHVVRALLDNGASVRVLDSFISSERTAVDKRVSVIEGDIRDLNVVATAMSGVTHVVHLAALVSVPLSVQDPELTHAVNVEGTKNIFDTAREQGVTRIVYASSAAVYGNEPSVPKREDSPLHPESPYATSKAENEQIAKESTVSAMGLRFFNVYGPGQSGSHPYASVIPRWMEALRDRNKITVFGDGSQTRDFVHVRDVAMAIVTALSAKTVGVVNIASGTERSLKNVIEMLNTKLGRSVDVAYMPSRAGDILRSFADISNATQVLGYVPRVEFSEGIIELLEAYKIT